MRRWKLRDFLVNAAWFSDVAVCQIGSQGNRIDFAFKPAGGSNTTGKGLSLRSEPQVSVVVRVIEWFFSDSISGKHKAVFRFIPYCQGKHAIEVPNEIKSLFFVQVDHNLCIGGRSELVATGFELLPQLREVVDLAIQDHEDRFVFIGDGLPSGFGVDDRKSRVPERHRIADHRARAVGTPVLNCFAHGIQLVRLNRWGVVEIDYSANSTHNFRNILQDMYGYPLPREAGACRSQSFRTIVSLETTCALIE